MPDTQTERHPDITSKYLEAAILDQVVMRALSPNPTALSPSLQGKKGWILASPSPTSAATTQQPRISTLSWRLAEWAQGLNEHIGWSDDEVMRIVISTMGGQPYERNAK